MSSSAIALPLPLRRSARSRWRVELALFGAAYLVYLVGRWVAVGEMGPALDHAHQVIDLERGLGVATERSVQQALDEDVSMWLLSNIYLAAQFVVLPAVLIWLYHRAPAIYRRLRDTVLATWLISVPIYMFFPTAPPRLAGIGLADTVSGQAGVALTGHSTIFYNPLAAVPSLHCGFACAISMALFHAARHRVTAALALLWGPTVCLTVVATGNHYYFDIVAGVLVSILGYAAGRLPGRLVARAQPA